MSEFSCPSGKLFFDGRGKWGRRGAAASGSHPRRKGGVRRRLECSERLTRRRIQALKRGHCGRGLAPDDGVSAVDVSTDPPPSGASPLPHLTVLPAPPSNAVSRASQPAPPNPGIGTRTLWEGACPLPHLTVLPAPLSNAVSHASQPPPPNPGIGMRTLWEGACPQ